MNVTPCYGNIGDGDLHQKGVDLCFEYKVKAYIIGGT